MKKISFPALLTAGLTLAQVVPAATGTFAGAAGDGEASLAKWAVQSGGFAAVFVPLAYIAFRWLTGRLEASQSSEAAANGEVIKILTEVVKTSIETNKHVTIMLESVGKLCEKTVHVVDMMERRMDRESDNHHQQG